MRRCRAAGSPRSCRPGTAGRPGPAAEVDVEDRLHHLDRVLGSTWKAWIRERTSSRPAGVTGRIAGSPPGRHRVRARRRRRSRRVRRRPRPPWRSRRPTTVGDLVAGGGLLDHQLGWSRSVSTQAAQPVSSVAATGTSGPCGRAPPAAVVGGVDHPAVVVAVHHPVADPRHVLEPLDGEHRVVEVELAVGVPDDAGRRVLLPRDRGVLEHVVVVRGRLPPSRRRQVDARAAATSSSGTAISAGPLEDRPVVRRAPGA